MSCYKKLNWDSAFFGFSVAQITAFAGAGDELTRCLDLMRKDGIRLAYASADLDAVSIAEVIKKGGIHVDQKTVYRIQVQGRESGVAASDPRISRYDQPVPDENLVRLAVEAGVYSRFNTDERIGKQKFIELYTKWIEQSVSHAIAKEVLVCREDGVVCGMITLGEKDGSGNIGLVAVDASKRGSGLGIALIREAIRWFAAHGYREATVVTQGFNGPACRLYEKCGFTVASSEAYFHFWL
jgi:dTDP-4-amino-4,6-dideoxy-D-galactose acyltransferase